MRVPICSLRLFVPVYRFRYRLCRFPRLPTDALRDVPVSSRCYLGALPAVAFTTVALPLRYVTALRCLLATTCTHCVTCIRTRSPLRLFRSPPFCYLPVYALPPVVTLRSAVPAFCVCSVPDYHVYVSQRLVTVTLHTPLLPFVYGPRSVLLHVCVVVADYVPLLHIHLRLLRLRCVLYVCVTPFTTFTACVLPPARSLPVTVVAHITRSLYLLPDYARCVTTCYLRYACVVTLRYPLLRYCPLLHRWIAAPLRYPF